LYFWRRRGISQSTLPPGCGDRTVRKRRESEFKDFQLWFLPQRRFPSAGNDGSFHSKRVIASD
jgi:hypothetical protein